MPRLKLQVESIRVESFEPSAPDDGEMMVITPRCVVTGGIDSCWCSEYASCDCT